MANKRIEARDLIASDAFEKAILDAHRFGAELEDVMVRLKGIMDMSKAMAQAGNTKSSSGIQNVVSGYNQINAGADIYTKTQQQINRNAEKTALLYTSLGQELVESNKLLQQTLAMKKRDVELTEEQVGAYQHAVNQLERLKGLYKNLHVLGKANTDEAKALWMEMDKVLKTVQGAERSVGQFNRNVGNYASGQKRYNYELFQMQQIMRELPNFAISARIGIMSLSNNLPQLGDAFRRIREDGNSFGKTMGIMAKSIISWQSLLLVGITLLLQFTDAIVDWVSSMSGANAETERAIALRKEFNEIDKSNNKQLGKERAEVELLVSALYSENVTREEKNQILKRLNEISPKYLGFLTEENYKTDLANQKIQQYIANIEKLARAKAVMEKYSLLEGKIIDIDTAAVHLGSRDEVGAALGGEKFEKAAYGRAVERIEAYRLPASRYTDTRYLSPGDPLHEIFNQFYIEEATKSMQAERMRLMAQQGGLINYAATSGLAGAFAEVDHKDPKDKKEKYNTYGKELAAATVGSMTDGYVKEIRAIMAEYAEKRSKAMFDHGIGPNDPLIMALTDQEYAERQKVTDKYAASINGAWEKDQERIRDEKSRSFQQALANNEKFEQIALEEQQARANVLLKETTDAKKRKEITKKNDEELLKIKIEYLKKRIALYKIEQAMNGGNVLDVKALEAQLGNLESSVGVSTSGDDNDQKKILKENMKAVMQLAQALDNLMMKNEQRRQAQLERQIEQTKRRQDELKMLAALGSKEAKDNIAFEERRQAELERKQQQIQRRAQQRQIAIAALNAYSQKVSRGDQNATANTIQDISAILAFIGAATFYEGTESLGRNDALAELPVSKDQFLIRGHRGERIVPTEENNMIGDMTNRQLAELAWRHRVMGDTPVSVGSDDRVIQAIEKQTEYIKKIEPAKTQWNAIEKGMEHTFNEGQKQVKQIERASRGGLGKSSWLN